MIESIETFTTECKEEIATSNFPFSNTLAFLSGYSWTCGSLKITSEGELLDLSSGLAKVAKCLYTCFVNILHEPARFSYTSSIGFAKKVKYHCLVKFTNELSEKLDLDFLSFPEKILLSNEDIASFICGAFLAGGSVSDPAKGNYHFEISCQSEHYAKFLSKLINKQVSKRFNSKVTKRRNHYIVYLKQGDLISEMLVLIGATESCLKYEDIRLNKDFSNILIRDANLDQANFEKVHKASEEQIKEIKYIDSRVGLDKFAKPNTKLSILIKLRLDNPDASLSELSVLLSEEIASTVTKSNINHLFRYIHSEYERLQEE